MLEDTHIQLELAQATEEENKPLLPFDLILRANEDGTAYTSFDIFNYDQEQIIATIKFNGEAWVYSHAEEV